jgi:hypothetical protein
MSLPDGPGGQSGPQGPLASRFEDGLRLLVAALAIRAGQSGPQASGAAISSACGAIRCFLTILDAAQARGLPDPDGSLLRLRGQCEALLDPRQDQTDAQRHVLEAAGLARDAAARVLALMPLAQPERV